MDFANIRDVNIEQFFMDRYGSFDNLIREAKSGNAEAQADLGCAYSEGFGVSLPQDTQQAIGWLNAALDNGHATPYVLGKLGELLDREGVSPQHRQKAYEMYHRAAQMGSTDSQISLAEMYRCGVEGVVNEDINEAFKWYKKAADEDPFDINPGIAGIFAGTMKKMTNALGRRESALKLLYKYYLEGDCPEKRPQPTKAVHYLTRAAELGDTEAQSKLGRIYMSGGCEQAKDVGKAKRWLKKAASNGDVMAEELLKQCKEDDTTEHSEAKKESIKESFEIMDEKLKKRAESQKHPYVISQPVAFTEEMLSGFAWSPTATVYLQAYKLVNEGVKVLLTSEFTDKRGLSLIAQGYLTENSIFQAFPFIGSLLPKIYQLCEENLRINPCFFEGLLLAYALHPFEAKSFKMSWKTDSKKGMCIKNLIHLILKAEPDSPPQKAPYEFDKNHSSWLHVLYYHYASICSIGDCFEKGAEAFENSLKRCPAYFEAKFGLANCLKNLYYSRTEEEKPEVKKSAAEQSVPWYVPPAEDYKRNASKFASYTAEKCKTEGVEFFKEFLEEAPVCYKNYPNAWYHLAQLFMADMKLNEFKECYERGQDAEEKRLPFFDPVDLPTKDVISPMYQLLSYVPVRCGNEACTKKLKKKDLKSCSSCRIQQYCSKECQIADWKNHKASCTVVGQKSKGVA